MAHTHIIRCSPAKKDTLTQGMHMPHKILCSVFWVYVRKCTWIWLLTIRQRKSMIVLQKWIQPVCFSRFFTGYCGQTLFTVFLQYL